jgi:hypothetical protein
MQMLRRPISLSPQRVLALKFTQRGHSLRCRLTRRLALRLQFVMMIPEQLKSCWRDAPTQHWDKHPMPFD